MYILAERTEVLDEMRSDVRVVRGDDCCVVPTHRTTIGIRSQPRTVEVGASLIPL